jgi:hypothetical protein
MVGITSSINVFLNMFGPIISDDQIAKLLSPDNEDKLIDYDKALLDAFFKGYEWRSEKVLKRYTKVGDENFSIIFIPHTNELYTNISSPLRSAKRLFCLEEYVATIGLSGIVSEMLSMLIWNANKEKVNVLSGNINLSQEIALFGKDMQSQGQLRRVEILSCLGFIDKEMKQAFDRIRTVRKNYLHFWDIDIKSTEALDAEKCLRAAFYLYKCILKLRFDQGKVIYDDAILKYARKTHK